MVDLNRLRHIADQVTRHEVDEARQNTERAVAQSQEANWAKARQAIRDIPRTLEEWASKGQRTGTIYSCGGLGYVYKSTFATWWLKSHPKKRVGYVIPDYAQFVFDGCQKAGLNPEWHYYHGNPSAYTPAKLSITLSF